MTTSCNASHVGEKNSQTLGMTEAADSLRIGTEGIDHAWLHEEFIAAKRHREYCCRYKRG